MSERKYAFSWDLVGDLNEGRPSLGIFTRIELYRLMKYTLRDVIEAKLGTEETDELFYNAGKMNGCAFYEYYLGKTENVSEFTRKLQSALIEMKVGVLRIESITKGAENLVLTLDEDLTCSGLPDDGYEICVYDEGLIAGFLEGFTGHSYRVKETECWHTGYRTCRFTADMIA